MPSKTICVLANSTKRDARCVAGRQITPHPDGERYNLLPRWVRPVSDSPTGELTSDQTKLDGLNSKQPKVFDIIKVPVLLPAPIPGQPENWVIDTSKGWTLEGSFEKAEVLKHFVEEIDDLWLDPNEDRAANARATPAFIQGQANLRSLVLIKPDSFRYYVTEKFNPWTGRDEKKPRGRFSYKGTRYDLPITDPVIWSKYFSNLGRVDAGFFTEGVAPVEALCLSLAPPFDNQPFHFKLIATIVEA